LIPEARSDSRSGLRSPPKSAGTAGGSYAGDGLWLSYGVTQARRRESSLRGRYGWFPGTQQEAGKVEAGPVIRVTAPQVLRRVRQQERHQVVLAKRRHLDKQILVTSRHDWDSVSIVRAYRRLTRNEDLFRISKSRPGVWWPPFHWTDSKIRVHALYCFLALVLLAILRLQLHRAGCSVSVDRAVRRLKDIDETLVIDLCINNATPGSKKGKACSVDT